MFNFRGVIKMNSTFLYRMFGFFKSVIEKVKSSGYGHKHIHSSTHDHAYEPTNQSAPTKLPAIATRPVMTGLSVTTAMIVDEKKQIDQELLESSKSTEEFTITGPIAKAKIVYVYDGDTIHAVFWFNGRYQRFKLRCYGYNSPELRPKRSEADRDEIIRRGKLARDAISDAILDKIVRLECFGFDVFGRVIVKIYHDGVYINDWMIAEGHGIPYMRNHEEVEPLSES